MRLVEDHRYAEVTESGMTKDPKGFLDMFTVTAQTDLANIQFMRNLSRQDNGIMTNSFNPGRYCVRSNKFINSKTCFPLCDDLDLTSLKNNRRSSAANPVQANYDHRKIFVDFTAACDTTCRRRIMINLRLLRLKSSHSSNAS
ncbi:unnamed protein product [Clavelina lepadiformis]|uniref:Uncharacterized protein n=1 Tax=Clavelina lepadiformis TaxID=159417 RepID=A0ABP0FP53_CLALP